MSELTRRFLRGLSFVGLLSVGWFAVESEMTVWAEAPSAPRSTQTAGDAEGGRVVFNGKGVCSSCHGIDGNKDQPPQLAADTIALIDQLNPALVDLRNPKALSLKTDEQRAHAIREGHPGTGMLPDKTITNQELADTLSLSSSPQK